MLTQHRFAINQRRNDIILVLVALHQGWKISSKQTKF